MNYFLTINAGSSSIKFDLFQSDQTIDRVVSGSIVNIGLSEATLQTTTPKNPTPISKSLGTIDFNAAVTQLLVWVHEQTDSHPLQAIGHRVVHGGPNFVESAAITPDMLTELKRIIPFDPLHLPLQISLIEQVQAAFPQLTQYASFDTAFHKDLPTVAKLFALPRSFAAAGIRRYGFHGLSFSYLLSEVEQQYGSDAALSRLIFAHLGNGVSLAAVLGGKSIDTTMGFTPTGGVPMSTRSGDLDPGVLTYLSQQPQWNGQHLDELVTKQSGLLGISETTADMKQLLEQETTDPRAADAVNLFCYQVRKAIGAYAAALGGVDRIVFTGGMGEEAPKIRDRILTDLAWLGIDLDAMRNESNNAVITTNASQVAVNVMHTDEAITIARDLQRLVPPPTEAAA